MVGKWRSWVRGGCLCAVLVAAGCSRGPKPAPDASAERKPFSFEHQLGLAIARGADGCLAVSNPSIPAGTRVILVRQPDVSDSAAIPEVEEATVAEALDAPCDDKLWVGDHDGAGQSSYRLRITDTTWSEGAAAIGIIDPRGEVSVQDRTTAADLDGDGRTESFRACASSEGVHYQIWSGPALTGKPQFHWYLYAGYETMPTCTSQDYFGPNAK